MARITPLFSSSKGNSYYIGNEKAGILIDCGASYSQMKSAMELCGYNIGAVKGVFVTHEHSDHIKGLKMLQKNLRVPIYGSLQTIDKLIRDDKIFSCDELYDMQKPSELCGMRITAFKTPHDSVCSVGYVVETEDERKIAVCTDLGEITDEVQTAVTGCDLCVLEANYDEQMLRENPIYPAYLKRRIASSTGHLSNTASTTEARHLIESGTTRLILGHLSQNNNTPQTALTQVLSGLCGFGVGKDFLIDVAPVTTMGKTIIL